MYTTTENHLIKEDSKRGGKRNNRITNQQGNNEQNGNSNYILVNNCFKWLNVK